MTRDRADDSPRRDGFVRVRGAREHNLKDVDVDIPRDALVVFTGVSGSGKSSLAFGTLYAEAQRRYLESVRSEEHTSELQSLAYLVCRLMLEKKNNGPLSIT